MLIACLRYLVHTIKHDKSPYLTCYYVYSIEVVIILQVFVFITWNTSLVLKTTRKQYNLLQKLHISFIRQHIFFTQLYQLYKATVASRRVLMRSHQDNCPGQWAARCPITSVSLQKTHVGLPRSDAQIYMEVTGLPNHLVYHSFMVDWNI